MAVAVVAPAAAAVINMVRAAAPAAAGEVVVVMPVGAAPAVGAETLAKAISLPPLRAAAMVLRVLAMVLAAVVAADPVELSASMAALVSAVMVRLERLESSSSSGGNSRM